MAWCRPRIPVKNTSMQRSSDRPQSLVVSATDLARTLRDTSAAAVALSI
jgi:hypothetical protein